jgi:quinol monooxygenase YgiN
MTTDANQAAFEAHGKTEHFQSVVKTATEEGLLAAPLDVKKVKAFAGFNKR